MALQLNTAIFLQQFLWDVLVAVGSDSHYPSLHSFCLWHFCLLYRTHQYICTTAPKKKYILKSLLTTSWAIPCLWNSMWQIWMGFGENYVVAVKALCRHHLLLVLFFALFYLIAQVRSQWVFYSKWQWKKIACKIFVYCCSKTKRRRASLSKNSVSLLERRN